MLTVPDAVKNVPVFVRVLNSIRSAAMRLVPDTKTTLPDAISRSMSVKTSAWSAKSWMSLQSIRTSLARMRVARADVLSVLAVRIPLRSRSRPAARARDARPP